MEESIPMASGLLLVVIGESAMEESIPMASGLLLLVIIVGALVFSLATLAFWIWSLISAAQNPTLDSNTRMMWILVILFVGVIGSLIYLVAGRNGTGQVAAPHPQQKYPPGKPY